MKNKIPQQSCRINYFQNFVGVANQSSFFWLYLNVAKAQPILVFLLTSLNITCNVELPSLLLGNSLLFYCILDVIFP